MGYSVKDIDELASIHEGIVKLAGAGLGVESFGLQVLDLPPRFEHYPEHDHADDGQEEVYVVLRGSADCEVGGEHLSLSPGRMLRVASGTKRRFETGAEGVRILAIGCIRGGSYERPDDFRLAVQS